MNNLYIQGLESYYDINNEVIYYFSDQMRKDDILFKLDEHEDFVVMILDKTNAQTYYMAEGPFAPIELRRIIEDVFALQKNNDKATFTEMMAALSEQYTVSKGQLKEHADEMFSTMVWELTLVETMAGGLGVGHVESIESQDTSK